MSDNDSINVMKLGDQIYAMSENDTLIRVDPESLKRQQKAGCHALSSLSIYLVFLFRF